MGIEFKITGPHTRKHFKVYSDIIGKALVTESAKSGRQYAELFRTELKNMIEKQLRSWRRLKPYYLAAKVRAGLDHRILIATGRYKDSFVTEKAADEKGKVTYNVTVPDEPHDPADESSINLKLLARVLEYGSAKRNIPPRPHWRPVFTKVWKLRKKFMKDMTSAILRAALRKIKVQRWPVKVIK